MYFIEPLIAINILATFTEAAFFELNCANLVFFVLWFWSGSIPFLIVFSFHPNYYKDTTKYLVIWECASWYFWLIICCDVVVWVIWSKDAKCVNNFILCLTRPRSNGGKCRLLSEYLSFSKWFSSPTITGFTSISMSLLSSSCYASQPLTMSTGT